MSSGNDGAGKPGMPIEGPGRADGPGGLGAPANPGNPGTFGIEKPGA